MEILPGIVMIVGFAILVIVGIISIAIPAFYQTYRCLVIYVDGFTGHTRKQIFSVGAFSYKGAYKKAKEMAEEIKMSYEYTKTLNII
jgi:hypothetical protein